MLIAIIEDDANKRDQLKELAICTAPNITIVEARSFSSGRKLIVEKRPKIVLLDMSMPTFDVTSKDKGGKPLGFGGREIMEEITRLRIGTKIIVVTQFDVFGEGSEEMTLKELSAELEAEFPRCYRGTVYYHPAMSDWKVALSNSLGLLIAEESSND